MAKAIAHLPVGPRRWTGPVWRESRTAAKKQKVEHRRDLEKQERVAKSAAKTRDGYRCRFPLCGCKALRLALEARLESSHDTHKGMGGNPRGDRNVTANLGTLCKHRHQDGPVSITKGTLRPHFLTKQGFDGIIAWEVDVNRLRDDHGAQPARWFEVARETAVQMWAPFTAQQRAVLERLADMEY